MQQKAQRGKAGWLQRRQRGRAIAPQAQRRLHAIDALDVLVDVLVVGQAVAAVLLEVSCER